MKERKPDMHLSKEISTDTDSLISRIRSLENAVQELSFLNTLALEISSSLDSDSIIRSITRMSVQATNAEQGAITLLENESINPNTLVRTFDGLSQQVAISVESSILGWMLQNRKPLLLNSPALEAPFDTSHWSDSIRSLICAPLVTKGNLVGIMSVFNNRSIEGFASREKQMLGIIAGQSAQVIENARLYENETRLNREKDELNDKLQNAYLDTIYRLVLASEFKDEDTGNHIKRMSTYCAMLAREYGMDPVKVELIRCSAPMHDVGKIGIPDSILLKPGKLTDEEFDVIKTHTTIGARILDGSDSEILQHAREIALNHHEHWNGKGYPNGLSGEDIPITGRIACIADVFDALTSKRPYKPAFPVDKAYRIILEGKGSQFDPDLVDLFQANLDGMIGIMHRFAG